MKEERLDLPQGTLDLLILKALALEPLHGWAISERLQQISRALCKYNRVLSIRRCIGSNIEDGSKQSGQ